VIEKELDGLESRINQLIARKEVAESDAARLREEVSGLDQEILAQNQVLKTLQAFADKLQHLVEDDVSNFVTEGVKAVFGREKQFKLEFGLRGNQVVANMMLDDLPLNSQKGGVFSQSGGVLHVVSWLLRLWVILRLSLGGAVSRVVLMDEPFGWLSPQYVPNVSGLMASLSKDLGCQTIFITRDPLLVEAADVAYVAEPDVEKGLKLTVLEEEAS
jgi:DNA repair exonuclease SbcCD ATPase subunit